MKLIFLLLATALTPPMMAQTADLGEAQETIRFIRLAQTKKQLDYDDQTLLKVNEVFDHYESARFKLIHKEAELRRRGMSDDLSDQEASATFDEFRAVREELHDLENQLWNDMGGFLSGKQLIEVFIFYDQFQKEIFRRARNVQQKRQSNRPQQRRRRQ